MNAEPSHLRVHKPSHPQVHNFCTCHNDSTFNCTFTYIHLPFPFTLHPLKTIIILIHTSIPASLHAQNPASSYANHLHLCMFNSCISHAKKIFASLHVQSLHLYMQNLCILRCTTSGSLHAPYSLNPFTLLHFPIHPISVSQQCF